LSEQKSSTASAVPDEADPQPSVVALLDALGFKSLAGSSAAGAMRSARQVIGELTTWMNEENWQHVHALGGRPSVSTSWFSDTICIVAQSSKDRLVTPNKSETMPALLAVAAMSVGYLLKRAAVAEFPLVFRGAITVGEMAVVDENIYVGPAINEASTLYEQADGAFVWLAPAASEIRLPNTLGRNHRALVEHDVPLRDGRKIHTKVVNPFIDMMPSAQPGIDVRAGIVRAMRGDRVDVVIKRQNTIEFLDHVVATEPPPPVRRDAAG
jgi:hypothetical protein